jgi:hypothetical protein
LYVSVLFASSVACRFSDILCLPKASLEKPPASFNDNLQKKKNGVWTYSSNAHVCKCTLSW